MMELHKTRLDENTRVARITVPSQRRGSGYPIVALGGCKIASATKPQAVKALALASRRRRMLAVCSCGQLSPGRVAGPLRK